MGLCREKLPLTLDRLKELLSYDLATGIFRWNINRKRVRAGDRAGCFKKTSNGRYINIDDVTYVAQRLAWFYTYGKWPGQLRFKNRDTDDCRIDNLMECFALAEKYDHQVATDRQAYRKAYYKSRGKIKNEQRRESVYGVSAEKYAEIVLKQNGVCAICARPETGVRNGKLKALAIDHCHATGKIRELLCQSCNGLLGMAADNIDTLRKAIRYLQKHSGEGTTVVPFKVIEKLENKA
jgi:hypothetical protein